MKLVIGGAFQGKLAYAKKTFQTEDGWIDGEICEPEDMKTCRGIYHFHLLVRRMLEKEEETAGFFEEIVRINPKICIVTNELGCGVVPIDAFDRGWREKTGRICTMLAEEAEEVHRVCCGIGTVIKR